MAPVPSQLLLREYAVDFAAGLGDRGADGVGHRGSLRHDDLGDTREYRD